MRGAWCQVEGTQGESSGRQVSRLSQQAAGPEPRDAAGTGQWEGGRSIDGSEPPLSPWPSRASCALLSFPSLRTARSVAFLPVLGGERGG